MIQMKNSKSRIRIGISLLICTFLLLQFKLADKNAEIKYQQDISLLLEKEAQEQYAYIEKEITDRLDWYNKVSAQVFNKQAADFTNRQGSFGCNNSKVRSFDKGFGKNK